MVKTISATLCPRDPPPLGFWFYLVNLGDEFLSYCDFWKGEKRETVSQAKRFVWTGAPCPAPAPPAFRQIA